MNRVRAPGPLHGFWHRTGGSVDDPCDEATRHKRVSGRSVRAHVISPALVVFNDAEGAKQHGFVKDSLANGAMPR